MSEEFKQFDLFGNAVEVVEEKPKAGRPKYRTMQELHGTLNGCRCGECVHCVAYRINYKTYYKCGLWIISNSAATDIRLKDPACRRFGTKVVEIIRNYKR